MKGREREGEKGIERWEGGLDGEGETFDYIRMYNVRFLGFMQTLSYDCLQNFIAHLSSV